MIIINLKNTDNPNIALRYIIKVKQPSKNKKRFTHRSVPVSRKL